MFTRNDDHDFIAKMIDTICYGQTVVRHTPESEVFIDLCNVWLKINQNIEENGCVDHALDNIENAITGMVLNGRIFGWLTGYAISEKNIPDSNLYLLNPKVILNFGDNWVDPNNRRTEL